VLLAIILNNLSQADAAVLDFAEAFEKVPHRHLRAKLKWCNLSQQVIGWIESLLCSPARRVIVDVTGSLCLNRYPTGHRPRTASVSYVQQQRNRRSMHHYIFTFLLMIAWYVEKLDLILTVTSYTKQNLLSVYYGQRTCQPP